MKHISQDLTIQLLPRLDEIARGLKLTPKERKDVGAMLKGAIKNGMTLKVLRGTDGKLVIETTLMPQHTKRKQS